MKSIIEKIYANNRRIEKLKESNNALRSQLTCMLWVARDRDDDSLHVFSHCPQLDKVHGQWYDTVINDCIELDFRKELFPSVTFENSPVPFDLTPITGKHKKK